MDSVPNSVKGTLIDKHLMKSRKYNDRNVRIIVTVNENEGDYIFNKYYFINKEPIE